MQIGLGIGIGLGSGFGGPDGPVGIVNPSFLATGDSFNAGSGGYAPYRGWGPDYRVCDVVSQGWSGANSTTILANTQAAYGNPTDRARTQVLSWGTNDGNSATLVANIKAWHDECGHDRFIIRKLYEPVGGSAAIAANNAAIAADPQIGGFLVPEDMVPGDSSEDLVTNNDSGDNIHPNPDGYDIIAASDAAYAASKGFGPVIPSTSWPTSKLANSIQLNGIDTHWQLDSLPYNRALNWYPRTGSAKITGFAFSVWVKGLGQGALLRIQNNGPYQNYFYIAGNSNAGWYSGGTSYVTTGVNLATDTWHHVVWIQRQTAAGDTVEGDVWVDGVLELQNQALGNQIGTLDGLTMGARFNTSGDLGNWANTRVWQPTMHMGALTAGDVAAIYNGGSGIPLANYPKVDEIAFALDTEKVDGTGYGPLEVTLTPTNLGPGNISGQTP